MCGGGVPRARVRVQAQDVCEIAINAREHLNDSRSQLDSVQKEARRRQDQLAKMEAQRELSLNELRRLKVDLEEAVSTQDVSSLDAVQDGPDVDPAQGDWDISALRVRSLPPCVCCLLVSCAWHAVSLPG